MKHEISISVDGLTEEAFKELEESVGKLLGLERIGNAEKYVMELNSHYALEAELRRIYITGKWPFLIYGVRDFVTDREEKRMTEIGFQEYARSEI